MERHPCTNTRSYYKHILMKYFTVVDINPRMNDNPFSWLVGVNVIILGCFFSVVLCGSPDFPVNIQLIFGFEQNTTVYPYGTAIVTSCSSGHRTEEGQTSVEIVCGEGGLWLGLDFTCERKLCS